MDDIQWLKETENYKYNVTDFILSTNGICLWHENYEGDKEKAEIEYKRGCLNSFCFL